jgi:flavin-dependent dehydrogenase
MPICPVVFGTGLIGVAISRSLSGAGIEHVLIGEAPNQSPRLGESLNAEGSLEILRQFPELTASLYPKRGQALFYGDHLVSVEQMEYPLARSWYSLTGYPPSVQLQHVDRIAFDAAAFKSAIADRHCTYMDDRVSGLSYDPRCDVISSVQLARGGEVAVSYVFDATNHVRFVAENIGLAKQQLGHPQRVAFAHYDASDPSAPAPYLLSERTALVRLQAESDFVDGLAWCIPAGNTLSVGISVDPRTTAANAELLLQWVEASFAKRGIQFGNRQRGKVFDFAYEHYNCGRCFGANWLLAGPACCQFWFPAAAGIAVGLIAARLAPDVLQPWKQASACYQSYITATATAHASLDWMTADNPDTTSTETLQSRTERMIAGNVARFEQYVALSSIPRSLAFGESFLRFYGTDREMAAVATVQSAPPRAQGSLLRPSRPAFVS